MTVTRLRVACYCNQFFAGIGGEGEASMAPTVLATAPGVAAGLARELGEGAVVVASVACGDNYMAEHGESAASEVVELLRGFEPDLVVAGPAFGAGRYGLACGHVCAAARERLGVPAVTGMFPENPAVELFRARAVIVPTRKTAAGMADALAAIARIGLKLGRGELLAAPEVDGYLPRGNRLNEIAPERASTRAIDMLLRKLRGEPFVTEWPVPHDDRVAPPPALDMPVVRVAMVTTSGLVPKGNADRIPSAWATTWARYDMTGVSDLTPAAFETIHGGFDTTAANADPDRIVPIDAFRALEREGRLELHPHLYSTTGNMGSVADMRRIAREIAADLRSAEIDAVVVGAT